MSKMPSPEINDLGQAYRSKNLVPYPGAGISAGPGIRSSLPDEKGPAYPSQVADIIEQVRKWGRDQQRRVLQACWRRTASHDGERNKTDADLNNYA